MFVTFTVTPGRPPLVESMTTPEIVPRSDCAAASAGIPRMMINSECRDNTQCSQHAVSPPLVIPLDFSFAGVPTSGTRRSPNGELVTAEYARCVRSRAG